MSKQVCMICFVILLLLTILLTIFRIGLRYRTAVGTMTMFFQQWTGVNAILYYAPSIFQSLGLTGNTVSLLATGVVGIAYVCHLGRFCPPLTFGVQDVRRYHPRCPLGR